MDRTAYEQLDRIEAMLVRVLEILLEDKDSEGEDEDGRAEGDRPFRSKQDQEE